MSPHSPMWACRVVVAVEWASLLANKEERMCGYLLNISHSFNFSLTTQETAPIQVAHRSLSSRRNPLHGMGKQPVSFPRVPRAVLCFGPS